MTTTRKRPAATDRPFRDTTSAAKSNGYRRQDGYAAPTADDRADIDVLIAAAERGFRLAVQCLDCGQWLANPTSVRAHRGPRCRARLGVNGDHA
jgi:hypothetical protein